MAILNNPLGLTGKMGNLTAYKMNGLDKVIVRRKGGATKKRIKTAPEFERTRENYTEFSGCTMLTAAIRDAAFPVKHLGDIRFTGLLNAFGRKIQPLDDAGNRGERSLYLSRFRHMLTGFNFHGSFFFDNVVRHPVTVELHREQAMVNVTIPPLVNGYNLHLPWPQPYYRLILSLGLVGDVVFENAAFRNTGETGVDYHYTDWRHAAGNAPAATVSLQLQKNITPSDSFLLCIGIEMGMPDHFNGIATAKKTGAAKMLAVF